jgi:hypothetical protein
MGVEGILGRGRVEKEAPEVTDRFTGPGNESENGAEKQAALEFVVLFE